MTALNLLPDPERPWREISSLLTDREKARRAWLAENGPLVPVTVPAPSLDTEALGEAIAGLAALLGACEGCREPCFHTTDCPVTPGKLKPHGTWAAMKRHYQRDEELCGRCKAGQPAVIEQQREARHERAARAAAGAGRIGRPKASRRRAAA